MPPSGPAGRNTTTERNTMKKFLALSLAAALLAVSTPAQAAAAEGRGGLVGGLVGCCFGIRTAAAYNEGKSINIREWLQLIWVGYVWAALEGYSGVTTSDLQKAEPAYF